MSSSSQLFDKQLTKTDVEYRLQFPTRIQETHLSEIVAGSNYVDFDVKYGNEEKQHTFRCKIRNGKDDLYKKPVITKGWLHIVREKGFREGDMLKFYKVQGDSVNFKFEVYRKIKLFGQEIWGVLP
ncbi:B3 domain-containing protein [Quillaja saponaria]|uniref:B3 domain-containing protein n=1 Tax=Quillaja saponaria TaxID=32244 RepID=A0AAD7M146_QUISA|nr:B3 domain-containing protein [Quillaja saponaria]